MNATARIEKKKFNPLLIHVVISMILTAFLLYIDEGYYDFRWMQHWESWLFWLFMVACLVAGQTITDKWIFRKFDENGKLIVTNLIGLPIGFIIYLAAILSIGGIMLLFK
jgi:hypothetical protein